MEKNREDSIKEWKKIVNDIKKFPKEDRDYKTTIKLVNALNNLGEYKKAISNMKKLVDITEKDSNYYKEMARALEGLDNYDEALIYLNEALDREQNNPWIYYEIGFNLARLGRSEEAIKYLKKCDENKDDTTNFIALYSELGWNYKELNKPYIALKYFKLMEKLGRDDEWSNFQIGLTYIAISNFIIALQYLFRAEQHAKANNKNNPLIFSEIALVFTILNKNEEALEYLYKIEFYGKKDNWLYSQIALNLSFLEDYEGCLKNLNKAMELGRNDEWINLQFAWCYSHLNQPEKALEYFLKGEELGGKNDWTSYHIGITYKSLQKYDEALTYLDEIKDKKSFLGFVDLEMADIYSKIKNRKKTIEWLKNAKYNIVPIDEKALEKYDEIEAETLKMPFLN